MSVEIKENEFKIIRWEGWGYVQHTCKFDKHVLELTILTEPSELEGGDCKKTYIFKILKKKNSYIKFTEDYGDRKYYEHYLYDSYLNSVFKFDKRKNNKCVIL